MFYTVAHLRKAIEAGNLDTAARAFVHLLGQAEKRTAEGREAFQSASFAFFAVGPSTPLLSAAGAIR